MIEDMKFYSHNNYISGKLSKYIICLDYMLGELYKYAFNINNDIVLIYINKLKTI
jgi:hypothetical protein